MSLEAFLQQVREAELLRFTTAGSVDDGKSTLIGRLLHDSKNIYEDHLASLKKDSDRAGREDIDFALLTDGLKAEREQGITIDVAYRHFSTPRRRFIIADTPGHEQYTRNMVTGASTANLAVILIDASTGCSRSPNATASSHRCWVYRTSWSPSIRWTSWIFRGMSSSGFERNTPSFPPSCPRAISRLSRSAPCRAITSSSAAEYALV